MENQHLAYAKKNIKQFEGRVLADEKDIMLIQALIMISISEELHELNERQAKEFELDHGYEI